MGGCEFRSRPRTIFVPTTVRSLKKSCEIILAVCESLSQFTRTRDLAVTLGYWLCLLHPYTSVGRGLKEPMTSHCLKRLGSDGHAVMT